ncbi:MAG TPA: DUF503 domain-containing protein [Clostridia bacterium]|nr:DUF503 domain-containing protein [Clostridia bacterium]
MVVGLCSLELHLRGVTSLKEKRRIVKSLLQRLHNRFNVSAAEVDYQEYWQKARIGLACVSNESRHINEVLQQSVNFVEQFPEAEIIDYSIEIL